LTYVSGGSIQNCIAGGATKIRPSEILREDLPISQGQIDDWEGDATDGGTINNDYILDLGVTDYLGPIQIGTPEQPKNLTLRNGSHLYVEGTIYVTGDVLLDPGSTIELDSVAYGSTSGVIIADGKITVE